MLMLCGCCALAGAAALSGQPTPPTQPPAANDASAVGRRSLQQQSSCAGGVTLAKESEGTIDFYDGHDDNAECSWTITCPARLGAGVAPSLTFTLFDTEGGYDWVDVFDGTAGTGRSMAHLSGSALPAGSFRAEGSTMTVRFTSDGSVGGQGFAATYSCGTEADACTATAEQLLALPACAAVQAQLLEAPAPGSQPGCAAGTAAAEIVCPVACAELWLPATERCSQSSDPRAEAALEAAGPGVAAACEAAAEEALATAAATVTVSGLACHASGNAVYLLQPVPLNGRAHYATADGGWHLYWTPKCYGSAGWMLDSDSDDADTEAFLISAADAVPTGSAVWKEFCNGQWTNARLQLTPSQPDDGWCATALQRLAPQL
eukprot:COSAG06_NODE_11939_length_1444_cov_15.272119_1_plen_375_part_10